jgi:hypothetical protein
MKTARLLPPMNVKKCQGRLFNRAMLCYNADVRNSVMPESKPKTEWSYRVDATDRILEVSANWDEFATANDAASLSSESLIGTSIWDSISSREVRGLYAALFERVRSIRMPVEVPFRCDAPGCRRHMNLLINSEDGREVEFASQLLFEVERVEMPLLDSNSRRERQLIVMCSWCKKIPDHRGCWLEIEDAIVALHLSDCDRFPTITHGICPACRESLLLQLRQD